MDDRQGSYKFVMYTAIMFAVVLVLAIAYLIIKPAASVVEDGEAIGQIRPVARFELQAVQAGGAEAGATDGAAAAPKDAATVYATVCSVCHDAGVAGAPKTGDKAAWAPRIATGKEALYHSSLMGKGAMPPKGGATNLSDEEIKSAVDLLVQKGS